jgi:hypothetical protein
VETRGSPRPTNQTEATTAACATTTTTTLQQRRGQKQDLAAYRARKVTEAYCNARRLLTLQLLLWHRDYGCARLRCCLNEVPSVRSMMSCQYRHFLAHWLCAPDRCGSAAAMEQPRQLRAGKQVRLLLLRPLDAKSATRCATATAKMRQPQPIRH